MAEFLGAVNLIQGKIVHFLGSSELNHLSSVHHRQAVAADLDNAAVCRNKTDF